jgi:hypothetical protein
MMRYPVVLPPKVRYIDCPAVRRGKRCEVLGGIDARRGPTHSDKVSTGSRLQYHDHAE